MAERASEDGQAIENQKSNIENPIGLLLSDDLIFTSMITGTASAYGFSIRVARSPEVLPTMAWQQPPRCVLIDLSMPGLAIADLLFQLQEASSPKPFIVAYGPHVDTATLKAAREAGCDVVLPRSKFVEELPRALPEWFGANKSEERLS